MPMGIDAETLRPVVETFRRDMQAARKAAPEVVVATSLPLGDAPKAAALVRGYADAGATGVVHGWRYQDATEFARAAERLAEARSR
jgi:hypothetical protein